MKLYHFLPWLILTVIITISGITMLSLANSDSATMDELAHIPAGYSYVKFQDYRLNPEHPPLVKVLAGLPLTLMSLNFPESNPSWQEEVNSQWAVGAEFIYHPENDANKIIFYSRLGPILLTLILIFLTYFWSRQLLGSWWALLPALLLSFSPLILSHGHYVTTDIGASLGALVAIFTFVKFLDKPSKKTGLLAGLGFGFAQLLKFSSIILLPLFVFLAIIHLLKTYHSSRQQALIDNKQKLFLSLSLRYLGLLIGLFFISFLFIYFTYAIFNFNQPTAKQNADTVTILSPLTDNYDKSVIPTLNRHLANTTIWLSQHKATAPIAEYLLGLLMVIQRASTGNTFYYLGQVNNTGHWTYFPISYLLKEPLPILIFIFLSALICLFYFVKNIPSFILSFFSNSRQANPLLHYLHLNFTEFSMLCFIIFYWVLSINNSLNIGIRHILPTIPLIYILTTAQFKQLIPHQLSAPNTKILLLFSLIPLWLIIETALAYPYYLSYYNQLAGGTMNGYQYITDSNYDWGQDLKRLTLFIEENNIDKIAVDYFGGDNPSYRLGDKFIPWWSAKNNPLEEDISYLAVSVNTLQNSIAKTDPDFTRPREDEYRWLKTARGLPAESHQIPNPDFKAGTTIFIYQLNN